MTKLLPLLIALLFGAGAASAQDALIGNDPDSTNKCGALTPGKTCYHKFASTDAAGTTADTVVYSVSSCQTMSYACDGDDTADLLIYEYRDSAGSGGNVWTDDMDNDGDVDASDEAITLDCTAGKRGFRKLAVSKPYHKIDVQTVPASGSAYVVVRCNGGDQ